MVKIHLTVPLLSILVWTSCGTDTRELAADEPVASQADTAQVGRPDNALAQVMETVPEMNSGFQTRDFDQDGTPYFTLDTHFVKKYKMVAEDYVFESTESWRAVGKMVIDNYILLFVNYKNTGADNLDLYVFDLEGQPLSYMQLSIGIAPGGQAPIEARVNPEGLVTVIYRDKVRKDFQITGEKGEFKLVKSVPLPK